MKDKNKDYEPSPMIKQYLQTKEKYPDTILFYRLGDFYEMFFEDAELVSRELELTLTGKDCNMEKRAPMCGIPYHAAKNYIARNYPEKLHLEDIAEYLNVSKYHFSRVFHASTGFSFRDYLCIYRLNKAKQFLLDEKGSIGEIGEKCGFDNGNYFAKVFKKHFSLSPGTFREEELLKTLKE